MDKNLVRAWKTQTTQSLIVDEEGEYTHTYTHTHTEKAGMIEREREMDDVKKNMFIHVF